MVEVKELSVDSGVNPTDFHVLNLGDGDGTTMSMSVGRVEGTQIQNIPTGTPPTRPLASHTLWAAMCAFGIRMTGARIYTTQVDGMFRGELDLATDFLGAEKVVTFDIRPSDLVLIYLLHSDTESGPKVPLLMEAAGGTDEDI